jgi:hypothetical protein
MTDRAATMIAMYRSGQTLQQIGSTFGVTRERARQILAKHGITARDGGQSVVARRKAEAFRAARDARFLRTKGCTFEQYAALRAMKKPTRAYSMQRKNADKRGIPWEFNLWTWWSVWQASGHWNERGRGNLYMMCRKGDVGPYAPDNVFIARGIVNSSREHAKISGLPMGVSKRRNRYIALRQIHGQKIRLGSFPSPELAHAAYLAADPELARAA